MMDHSPPQDDDPSRQGPELGGVRETPYAGISIRLAALILDCILIVLAAGITGGLVAGIIYGVSGRSSGFALTV